MSEVVVITSGKGGVGKTTTTANVGTGLAKEGKKVVLIDTDIGLRNLDVVMGLENRIVYNLVDVIEGNCRIKQALIKDKRYPWPRMRRALNKVGAKAVRISGGACPYRTANGTAHLCTVCLPVGNGRHREQYQDADADRFRAGERAYTAQSKVCGSRRIAGRGFR